MWKLGKKIAKVRYNSLNEQLFVLCCQRILTRCGHTFRLSLIVKLLHGCPRLSHVDLIYIEGLSIII